MWFLSFFMNPRVLAVIAILGALWWAYSAIYSRGYTEGKAHVEKQLQKAQDALAKVQEKMRQEAKKRLLEDSERAERKLADTKQDHKTQRENLTNELLQNPSNPACNLTDNELLIFNQ